MVDDGRDDRIRWRLRVWGLVQGVFFRASTEERALALGVAGWVRNRDDGSVEIEAEGPKSSVEALASWARRGPPAARVDAVDVEEIPARSDETGFRVVS